VIATDTLPLKPFDDCTETATDLVVPPMAVVSDDGDTDKEKSGSRGAGVEDDPPPPQAELTAHNHTVAKTAIECRRV
jgi:hypothetical protein